MALKRPSVNVGYIYLAVFLVLLVLAITAFVVFVFIPWLNQTDFNSKKKRDRSQAREIRVILTCYGDLHETFQQLADVMNMAAFPEFISFRVVYYTQCPVPEFVSNRTMHEKAAKFRASQLGHYSHLNGIAGAEHLNMVERVQFLDIARAGDGCWSALCEGLTQADPKPAAFVVFFGPGEEPRQQWDSIFLLTCAEVAKGLPANAPFLVTQESVAGICPSFSQTFVLVDTNAAGAAPPGYMWRAMARCPSSPVTQTLVSNSFIGGDAAVMTKLLQPALKDLSFPPSVAHFVVTSKLIDSGVSLWVPMKNLVQPYLAPSTNKKIYMQTQIRVRECTATAYKTHQQTLMELLQLRDDRMGIDWTAARCHPQGLLGLGVVTYRPFVLRQLPITLINEIDAKWGSERDALDFIRRNSANICLVDNAVEVTRQLFSLTVS